MINPNEYTPLTEDEALECIIENILQGTGKNNTLIRQHHEEALILFYQCLPLLQEQGIIR